jgi:hypothetical protein
VGIISIEEREGRKGKIKGAFRIGDVFLIEVDHDQEHSYWDFIHFTSFILLKCCLVLKRELAPNLWSVHLEPLLLSRELNTVSHRKYSFLQIF